MAGDIPTDVIGTVGMSQIKEIPDDINEICKPSI